MDETAGLFLVDVLEIDSARLVPGRSDEVCACNPDPGKEYRG
jgi:hypothetical protein